MVWHDERWVKSHTELTNNWVRNIPVAFTFIHFFNKSLWAWLSDGSQILNDFLTGHTNTWIENNNGSFLRVGEDRNVEVIFAWATHSWISSGEIKPMLLESVRAVGKQFSQENFLICVNWLCDNVKQLSGLSLKFFLFTFAEGCLWSLHFDGDLLFRLGFGAECEHGYINDKVNGNAYVFDRQTWCWFFWSVLWR